MTTFGSSHILVKASIDLSRELKHGKQLKLRGLNLLIAWHGRITWMLKEHCPQGCGGRSDGMRQWTHNGKEEDKDGAEDVHAAREEVGPAPGRERRLALLHNALV